MAPSLRFYDGVFYVAACSDLLTVGISCDFAEDTASCYVKLNDRPVPVGKPHAMRFRLDHFTGARFALSYYSTKISGGEEVFTGFVRE